MRTKAELQKQLAEVDAKIRAFEASHKDKDPTAEEVAEYKGLVDQMEAAIDQMKLQERAAAAQASAAEPETPRVSLEIHNVADEAKYNFGEFLQDVAYATRTQMRSVPKRLEMHQKRNVKAAATGLNEGLPAEGGFLVGTDFVGGLIQKVYENSAIAKLCAKVSISSTSNSIKMNGINETSRAAGSRYGGVLGYWIAEAGSTTATKPAFRQIDLVLKKLGVLAYATDELIADASALESVVSACVVGELDFMLQDSLINGNGAGKPLGILQSPCLVTVTKETGQEADSIVFENISKMWARMWAPSRPKTVWLINQEIEPQLDKLAIPVGTGGMPVYMPPGGISGAPYGTIKGRPVIPIEQAAGLGDAGDIILADFSQYLLADKGGVQAASSMHVSFTTDEMVYRFIYRVDGQPIWNAALTPFKGTSNTLSPFVTLGARA